MGGGDRAGRTIFRNLGLLSTALIPKAGPEPARTGPLRIVMS